MNFQRICLLGLIAMLSLTGPTHAEKPSSPPPPVLTSPPSFAKSTRPVVLNPLCRVLKGCRNGAAFMTIYLPGPDVLTKATASSEIVDHVELHTHQEKDGVMRMIPLPQIPIPTGVLELKSGGDHLMLIGLKKELQPGEKIHLSLEFQEAGSLEVDALIEGSQWLKNSPQKKICRCQEE